MKRGYSLVELKILIVRLNKLDLIARMFYHYYAYGLDLDQNHVTTGSTAS